MSRQTKGVSSPCTASTSQESHQNSSSKSSNKTLRVTLLSSEWRSTKGGLSTFNRELAIQLAEHPSVEVSVYLPQCSEKDKKDAENRSVHLIEAEEMIGFKEPNIWLALLPKDHVVDCVIGHGVVLGRQVQFITRTHPHCKWIQVAHTAPEELGMYKGYEKRISKGEKKHQDEVELCKLADQVVAVGPKLAEAFSRYLRPCGKDRDVLNFTPGIFSEFADVKQATEEGNSFNVLVFGRGDSEDFQLKGYDIAAEAIVVLKDMSYKLVFVGATSGEEEKVAEMFLRHGIHRNQLTVRCFDESRKKLADLFCEVDLAIMPSRTEGFGLAALEALSAGLPVLVNGNSGFGEALKEVPYGSSWVVDSEDPKDWATAIRGVREKNRKLRLKESKFLRGEYAEMYSWQGHCNTLVERMLTICQGDNTEERDYLCKGSPERNHLPKSGKRPLSPSPSSPSKQPRLLRDEGEMAKRVHENPSFYSLVDWSDEEDDEQIGEGILNRAMDRFDMQHHPLFRIQFQRVGPRRRWCTTVEGQQFHTTITQLRAPTARDDLGAHLTDALHQAIEVELRTLSADSWDRVNFTMQAHGFTHAFQSVNFEVGEFLERTLRLDELLRQLAAKLNSNESLDMTRGLEITFNLVRMPCPGRGHGKRLNPGTKCLDTINKKKQCIITIQNDDALCCARAIVTMKAHCHKNEGVDGKRNWENSRKGDVGGRKTQQRGAKDLHHQAGVPEGSCGIPELQKFQTVLTPQYQLVVMCRAKPFMILFKGPDAPHQIRLLKSDAHYDGCTSFPAFVNKSYFCLDCEKGYDHEDAKNHSCEGRVCRACRRRDCPEHVRGQRPTLMCSTCFCSFHGPSCRQHHWNKKECHKFRTCLSCKAAYTVVKGKRHRCGMGKCPSCEQMVLVAEHKCFIQPVARDEPTEATIASMDDFAVTAFLADEGEEEGEGGSMVAPPPPPLLVYADIEAMQLPDGSFQANLLCYRTDEDDDTVHTHYGEGCCLQFFCDLDELTVLPDTDKERPVIVVFHNLKGFDGMFIMHELYKQQRVVEGQLTVGAKVLSFQSGQVTFKDSLCFLPMPLASFPATFGLRELKKGFFPHEFNTPDNQDYIGRIPDLHYYDPEGMTHAKRSEFEAWHADQVRANTPFNFKREMIAYCKSDVDLLQAGCSAFCKEFESIAGFNPFHKCVTIASACNEYWRRHHLPPDTIAVEPMQGWRGARVNQSLKALQWLYYRESLLRGDQSSSHVDRIRHVRNGGEQSVLTPAKSYFVDGYDASARTVYEFHGCLMHGCPRCHPSNRHVKRSVTPDRTVEELYLATLAKSSALRLNGYTVIEIWECEWDAQMDALDSPARHFVDTLCLVAPLQPRDAFFGGRTGAVALQAKAEEGEEIRYADVTSLYPWVNKTACYPVGHPRIITNPGHTDIHRFFGLATVDILPPADLLHPVLPVRSGGKLTFPLCRTCVSEQQGKSMFMRTDVCTHDESARMLHGTWCTPELEKALEKGYTLHAIHEVWHFPQDQQRTGLFREYVNTWLKIKQESAGWPRWCTTEEEKQRYIREYEAREGIRLDYNMIRKNPGRKAVAKLMLNSFWGKFGERQNKPQTHTVYNPANLFAYLTNTGLHVSTLRMCTDDLMEVVYTHVKDDAPVSTKTNIFIAAFTTCWARLKLYSYLDVLQDQVLYYDTDSVIYKWRPGQPSVPLGDYLGDMTDELQGDVITEFVSGGAKNYGYTTRGGKTECKVRGFTLNVRGHALLNFESMRAILLAELDDPQDDRRVVPVPNPNFFVRDNTAKRVKLSHRVKNYGLVFDKRIVKPTTRTSVPYGYTWRPWTPQDDENVNILEEL